MRAAPAWARTYAALRHRPRSRAYAAKGGKARRTYASPPLRGERPATPNTAAIRDFSAHRVQNRLDPPPVAHDNDDAVTANLHGIAP